MTTIYISAVIATYAVVLSLLALRRVRTQVLFWYFYMGVIILIPSNLYIETGVFVTELGLYSYHTGAALRLGLLLAGILASIWCLDWLAETLTRGRSTYDLKVNNPTLMDLSLAVGSLGVLVLCLFNIALSGRTALDGNGYIDRFDFLTTTPLWPLLRVFGPLPYIAIAVVGAINYKYSLSPIQTPIRLFAIVGLILFNIYAVLCGHKFGSLHGSLFVFFLPFLIHLKTKARSVIPFWKVVMPISLVLAAGIPLLLYHFSRSNVVSTIGTPLEFLVYRLAVITGHVYWAVDEQVILQGAFAPDGMLNLMDGMEQTMRLISPQIGVSMLERGVYFNRGFPGVILLCLPPFAWPLAIVSVTLLGMVLGALIRTLVRGPDVLAASCSIYAGWWYIAFLNRGSANVFLQPELVGFTIIVIFSSLMNGRRTKIIDKAIFPWKENKFKA